MLEINLVFHSKKVIAGLNRWIEIVQEGTNITCLIIALNCVVVKGVDFHSLVQSEEAISGLHVNGLHVKVFGL